MALLLTNPGRSDPDHARKAYVFSLESGPFDCGITVSSGLRGGTIRIARPMAMMQVSPLGIFGISQDIEELAE